MLRVASKLWWEAPAAEALKSLRRDVSRTFRTTTSTTAVKSQHPRKIKKYKTTVVTSSGGSSPAPPAAASEQKEAPPPPPPPPPPKRPPRLAWTATAAAVLTASIGGVYYYRKLFDFEDESVAVELPAKEKKEQCYPSSGSQFPSHVWALVAGGGTAAAAAARALRARRPDAAILLVSDELSPPYMRAPLSKELWREPGLPLADTDTEDLYFTQWNGKKRRLIYEPRSFYTPVEEVAAKGRGGGAALARGWRVTRLHTAKRLAEIEAPGHDPVTVQYDVALIATGSHAKRVSCLSSVRAAGLSLSLETAGAGRAAARKVRAGRRRVLVVGGGPRAVELAAAMQYAINELEKPAEETKSTSSPLGGASVSAASPAVSGVNGGTPPSAGGGGGGSGVVLVYREEAPLRQSLPEVLAEEAKRALEEAGVTLMPYSEVVGGEVREGGGARVSVLRGEQTEQVDVDFVVECVGSVADSTLALSSGLELGAGGGAAVSAELSALATVYAAGDAAQPWPADTPGAACRRHLTGHDHAVASARKAAENMSATSPTDVTPYTHRPLMWADLSHDLGYEAVGEIDSSLKTVSIFSSDAVTSSDAANQGVTSSDEVTSRRYKHGVVLYLRGKRVVGVLMWNLFNRTGVARQVLEIGEFPDLLEVGKLFSPHEG